MMRPESLSSKFSLKSRNKKTGTFRPLFFCLKALLSMGWRVFLGGKFSRKLQELSLIKNMKSLLNQIRVVLQNRKKKTRAFRPLFLNDPLPCY